MSTRADNAKLLNRLIHDPSTLDKLDPRGFEVLVAHLFASLGYEIILTPTTRDGGRDIIATFTNEISSVTAVVECKMYRSQKAVGIAEVRALYGVSINDRSNLAILVTNSRFTKRAQEFAKRIGGEVQLIDRARLLEIVREARRRENEKAQALAFSLSHLPLKTVEIITEPDFSDKSNLILPKKFSKRIVSVDSIPIQLLQAISSDPRHLHALSPRQFEKFIAELVDGIGFNDVVLTPRSYDGGKDVIASRIVNGIPLTFYFECKKYAEGNKIQIDTLRSLLGVVAHDSNKANIGVLVTTSTFTAGSKKLILSECRLDGKDYEGLTDWIDDYSKKYSI